MKQSLSLSRNFSSLAFVWFFRETTEREKKNWFFYVFVLIHVILFLFLNPSSAEPEDFGRRLMLKGLYID